MINDVSYKHLYLKKKAVFLSISSDTCFELGENLRLFLYIPEEPYSLKSNASKSNCGKKIVWKNPGQQLFIQCGPQTCLNHAYSKLPDTNKTLEINKLRCYAIKYSLIEQAQKFQWNSKVSTVVQDAFLQQIIPSGPATQKMFIFRPTRTRWYQELLA